MTTAWVPLATTTLSSTAASVTFGSISGSYRDLIIVAEGVSTSSVNGYLNFNSDTTGSNYNWVRMYGDGSTAASNSDTTTAIAYDFYTNRTMLILQIMDYSATDKHKTVLTRWNTAQNITGATAFRWANTSAITSITLDPGAASFSSGCTFSLYGSNRL
jgi:hypothetical protein